MKGYVVKLTPSRYKVRYLIFSWFILIWLFLRPQKNEGTLWRQHCDVFCPWQNAATLLCSVQTQQMFLKIFRNFFFCVQDTKYVSDTNVAYMAKRVNIWETRPDQQCCRHNVSSFCRGLSHTACFTQPVTRSCCTAECSSWGCQYTAQALAQTSAGPAWHTSVSPGPGQSLHEVDSAPKQSHLLKKGQTVTFLFAVKCACMDRAVGRYVIARQ